MLQPQFDAFQEIDMISTNVQTMLIAEMDKKVEGQLVSQVDEEKEEFVHQCFDLLGDLHLTAYSVIRDSKQSTADAKINMNEKRVELQDEMYERKHILEEIMKCRGFRSVYQDVELIPLDEFQQKAGPEYLENSDNPHQLMINRLKYELVVRSELKEQKEALELERAQLIKDNRKIQKKVDLYDKLLDDFVLSAAPVEEALEAEIVPNGQDVHMQEAILMDTTM